MSNKLMTNIMDSTTWKRALFMVLFAILYGAAEIVIWVVTVLQFFIVLFTGDKNKRLLEFGQSLATYIYQIMRFLTFNSETRPFPFGDWPDGPPDKVSAGAAAEPEQAESVDRPEKDTVGNRAENKAQSGVKQEAPDNTYEDTA